MPTLDCRKAVGICIDMTRGAEIRRPLSRGPRPRLTGGSYDAVIFDLDGVVTRTAQTHAAAWKRLFDEYLKERSERTGEAHEPFDIVRDYRGHVDGKPRYDGVASFLEARGIDIPRGDPNDAPTEETICGLGNRKNRYFVEILEREGVERYENAVALVRALRDARVRTAIVSSSKNCPFVLQAAELTKLFDAEVDGNDIDRLDLDGKPSPDMFVEAAQQLGVSPKRAAVIEDAESGVEAGRAGGFGLVIGVDRGGARQSLEAHGADVVVSDLGLLLPDAPIASAERTA